MARPSNYTDEEIINAADKVKAQGKPVTGYGLSKALGGGNPDTLARRYSELTNVAEPAIAAPVVPADVLAAVGEVTSDVGKRLTDILTTTYASLRAAANARVDEVEVRMEQQQAISADEIRDAVERIEEQTSRAEVAEESLKAAQEELQQLRVELSSKAGALAEAQRSEKQLAEKLEATASALANAERKVATLESKLEQSQAEKTRAEQQNERLSAQLSDVNSKREAALQDAAAKGAIVGQLQDAEKRLSAEIARLNTELGQRTAEATQLVNDKQALLERGKKQKEMHQQEMAKAQESLSAKVQELAKAQAEIQLLKEQKAAPSSR